MANEYDDIMETAEECLSEAFSSNAKVALAKGRSGKKYAVVSLHTTEGLDRELWYNLEQIDGDVDCPRLRMSLNVLDAGKFYTFKDEKFGSLEHPKAKSEDWWRRLSSKDLNWLNKQFRDWLASSAGKAFVDKNKLDGCLCVKNWLETAGGKRA